MTSTVHPIGIARRENGIPPPDVPLTDVDLASLEFWERDDDLRDGAFATLRRESPIAFFEVAEFPGFPAGAGHWALTRFDDIHHASRHPEIFSSIPTSTSLNEVPPEVAEFAGSMISLDDPRHLRLRTIVNRAFTPKVVARIEGSVRQRARTIVTNMVANHHDAQADFVAEASGLLPLQVICDMMGIPEEDEAKVFHWTNVMLGFGDDEVSGDFTDVLVVLNEIVDYAMHLAEERRANPGDDLTTSLVRAEVAVSASPQARSHRSSFCSRPPATRQRATPSVTAWWRCPAIPRNETSGGRTSTGWPAPPSRRSSDGRPRLYLCGAT